MITILRVFMNKTFSFLLLIVLFSCSSVPKSDSNYHSFDDALEIGIQKIGNDLPEGSDIAVLDFKADNPNLSSYIIEEMYDKLINSGKLSIMERSRINTIKMEVGYQLTGEVDDNEIINIGHQLGANYVVTGEISFSGEAYRLRIFAIDVEKGRRVASSSLNINSNDKQVNYLITLTNENDRLKGFISVETKPSVGNISIATGNLELSVLSSCLVFFDFGNFFEEINLPSSGTIPINNINPGFYSIILEYNDYTFQRIGFNILPGETTNLSLGYRSGPAPYFPPVSKIKSLNTTTHDGSPEWLNVIPPEDSIWGINENKDRYTAEKNAYVSIARQLSTSIEARYESDEDGLPIWEESFVKTKNISDVAQASEIFNVSYDTKNKLFWVLAGLSKSDAKAALSNVIDSEAAPFAEFKADEALKMLDAQLTKNEKPVAVRE